MKPLRRRDTLFESIPWLVLAAALVAAGYVAVKGTGGDVAIPRSITHAARTTSLAPKRPPPRATSPTPPAPVRLLSVRAARGDCWVEARVGSPAGAVLYRGLLRHGRTERFTAATVWISLGASANVDVVLDGRRQTLPNGTIARTFRTTPA